MGRGADLPSSNYCPIETFAVDLYVPFYEDCPVDDWRKEGVHIVGIGFYLIQKRRAWKNTRILKTVWSLALP